MTQKEAIFEALSRLGGKANLNDIYQLAPKLGDFSGSKNWKATIRSCLLREPDAFRPSKRGWWELISYQKEIASRDEEIARLRAEVEQLKTVKTEDDFVRRLVNATKKIYGVNRRHADYVRQVLLKLGRDEEQEELLTWIKNKRDEKNVTEKIIQKISNSQVFNGTITNSEFNGVGTER